MVLHQNRRAGIVVYKRQIRTYLLSEISSDYLGLVEVTGVEPVSENHFTEFSPGAVGYCGRRYRPVPFAIGKPTRR